ncbi:hypothetical protein VaNZ11_005431, partial [Volvox africanus]
PQRYTIRGPPMAQFKWDQPMQLCLTGGMLLLRCLQFPVAPGQLAWPGMFAFRLGDLLSGLTLGRCSDVAGPTVAQEPTRAATAAAAAGGPAASADVQQSWAAVAPAAAPPPTVVLSRTVQPEVLCGDGGFQMEWALGPGTCSSPDGVMRRSVASLQLLAAKRHLFILSESQEAWAMKVPYCRTGKGIRTHRTAATIHQ